MHLQIYAFIDTQNNIERLPVRFEYSSTDNSNFSTFERSSNSFLCANVSTTWK